MKRTDIHDRKLIRVLWLLLLLPLLSGCNDTDDLQAIFVGKTWRLTYINLKDQGGMMSGFSEESLENFNSTSDAYTLSFSGTKENDRITGYVSGKVVSSSLSGTWGANGKTNDFYLRLTSVNTNETDDLAQEFLKGLENASSYTGDENNLFLYYTDDDRTYMLAFHINK